MNNRKKINWGILFLLLSVFTAGACSEKEDPEPTKKEILSGTTWISDKLYLGNELVSSFENDTSLYGAYMEWEIKFENDSLIEIRIGEDIFNSKWDLSPYAEYLLIIDPVEVDSLKIDEVTPEILRLVVYEDMPVNKEPNDLIMELIPILQ